MSSQTMSFNLTQVPWIPVVGQDWKYKEVSLIELFETWGELREIQADNPPTTLAIYRLLLAILHRAHTGPRDEEHWEEIQDDDGKAAIAYLQKWRDRFDLLHPDRPFMQDIALTSEMAGEIYQAYALHGNNTSTVFCHEHQWSGDTLSIPAAARLVLRLHLFDVGGRKTGSAISAGVIPTMDAANVLVRGKTLQETLLLNLMQYDGEEYPCVVRGEDLPTWEREHKPANERIPAGYIDYLTYEWRRVRLFVEGDQAVRVAVHAGDRLPKTISPAGYECGIAYTKNPKKPGEVYTVRLNLSRSLWRDSAAFLQSSEAGDCPRIIGWMADLHREKLIDNYINLQVLGLMVDPKIIAKPLSWTSEQFSAPIAYLKEKLLWQSLDIALKFAENHRNIFLAFQGSPYYALSEGLNPPNTDRKAISQQARQLATTLDGATHYWAKLDEKFQELLHQKLTDPADKTVDGNGTSYGRQALSEWEKTVQKAAEDAFTASIASIRNYEARAKALRSLEFQLAKLRGGQKDEKPGKGKRSTKNQPKAS